VNNGSGAVSSVPTGVTGAFSFLPDGLIEGFGGCNNFSGQYSVDGDAITIGPLMSTMAACSDEINAFEAQFLTALQNSTTWSVSGGTLDLRDADEALQVNATSAIGR
jgi:heat shock protein HslJ